MLIPGTISAFAGEIDPSSYTCTSGPWLQNLNFGPTPRNNTGWILCDGSIFPVSLFPDLYAVIGNVYGGPPMQDARVPDYRGYFLRAITNDKGSPANNDRKPYQNGSGFIVGQKQEDMLILHAHHSFTGVGGSGGPPAPLLKSPPPPLEKEAQIFVFPPAGTGPPIAKQVTGEETRPINIYVNYLIYAGLPGSTTESSTKF